MRMWWLLDAIAAQVVASRVASVARMIVGWRCACGRGRVRWHSGFSDYTIHHGRLAPNWRSFWRCRACEGIFEEFPNGWRAVIPQKSKQVDASSAHDCF
jgi:hypothetical protein